jgi:hypothetical protein
MYRFVLVLLFSLNSTPSIAQHINAYAVAIHSSCNASSIPATIEELDKFFASPYFPQDAQRNVYYKDSQVKIADWHTAGDLFESAATTSGFDGADAPLISYIASHGVTARAKYKGLGGGGAAGCNIRSNSMSIGDGNARYLVLSTCQGLKIGDGDNPTGPGENPSITWRGANKGLNCIFGYSNNMVDASDYGAFLLENLATTDETLAQSFLKASRRVSESNIPAVLCFGADNAAAREYLNTTKRFTSEKVGRGGSAWTYGVSKRVEGLFEYAAVAKQSAIPRAITAHRSQLSAQRIAASFLGSKMQDQSLSESLRIFRSSAGTLTFNNKNDYFSFVKQQAPDRVQTEMKIDDNAAVRIAEKFLNKRSFISEFSRSLKPSYVVDRFVGSDKNSQLVEKTVVFSQSMNGLGMLGSSGTVDVVVGTSGEVTAANGMLLTLKKTRVAEMVDVKDINILSAEQAALRAVQRKLPNAKLTVVKSLIGYDSGDYSEVRGNLRAVAEILIEASEGGFARRYIERVAL